MSTSNGIYYSQINGLKISTSGTNRLIVSTAGTSIFTGVTSGSTLIYGAGTSGNLLSVTDTLTGPLLNVNNYQGLPIFYVNSNYSIIGGTPSSNTFVISGTNVGIGGILAPTNKLDVSGENNPVRFRNLSSSANTRFLTTNSDGVITFRTDVLTGFTDVFVTGGTYSGANGVTTFTNNTGGTFTVTFPSTASTTIVSFSAVTGSTYATGTTTFEFSGGGTLSVPVNCGQPLEYTAIVSQSSTNAPTEDLVACNEFNTYFGCALTWNYINVGQYSLTDNNSLGPFDGNTLVQCNIGINSTIVTATDGFVFYYEVLDANTINFYTYNNLSASLVDDVMSKASIRILNY